MTWADVEKGPLGQSTGRFLKLEDGDVKTIRLLDEEPHSIYVHRISQIVNGEEVFRSIPATEEMDDNFILNNSRRWPAMPQHAMRCIEVEDGEAVGDIVILSGGKQIFGELKKLYDRHGDLTQYDVEISREGTGLKTQYSVSMAPRHAKIDVEELQAEIEEDPAIHWEQVYPKVTGADQERMLAEAGMDIDYDPAEDLAEDMTVEEAMEVTFTFGKYKGKTVGEVLVVDAGWLNWAAENVTSDDEIAAACRVITRNHDKVIGAKPQPKGRVGKGSGAKKTVKEDRKPAAARREAPKGKETAEEASGADRATLTSAINEFLTNDARFEDAMEIANVIKEHGGGKTRLRDLTVAELQSLHDSLTGGAPEPEEKTTKGRRRSASR